MSQTIEIDTCCIAVTGLPASGKTTLARDIATRLEWPFFDKDVYLEQLFEARGTGNSAWRQSLSIKSNDLFRQAAEQHDQVVLVSHWRPPEQDGPSGTPTAWLCERYDRVLEVYCVCPVEVAAQRFATRVRHPGHLDRHQTLTEIESKMRHYAAYLPMALGEQMHVPTTKPIVLDELISRIHQVIRSVK
ncbi:MAG: AAA family ATPase [Pseudomonadota bacterium]